MAEYFCEDCGGNAEVLWDDGFWTCQPCFEVRQKIECFRSMKKAQEREMDVFVKMRTAAAHKGEKE